MVENNWEIQFHKDMDEDPDEKCGYIHGQSQCSDHSQLKHLVVIANNVNISTETRRQKNRTVLSCSIV